MNEKEKKAMKEVHYCKVKDMCYNYWNNEICIKHTFLEDAVNSLISFEDRRLIEINRLIDEFIKERDRIVEIEKLEGEIKNEK